jgi:hypothetical protein
MRPDIPDSEITDDQKANLIVMWNDHGHCGRFLCEDCVYTYRMNKIIEDGVPRCPHIAEYKIEMLPAMDKYLTESDWFLELI